MVRVVPFLVCTTLLAVCTAIGEERVWTSDTFFDFSGGTCADGGVNTYVAADGTVRLINLWDFNNDGNFDLPVACAQDHDERVELFIYWADETGFSPKRRTLLPTEGAIAATAADLDGDGYPELIVANRFDGENTNLDVYIYWGSPDGFDVSRRTSLPARAARAVTVADLDRDGYPDIVIANQGVEYHMTFDRFRESYVYWGSKEGYSPERRTSLATINCADVKVSDFDRDGHLDILFANEGHVESDGGVVVYLGRSSRDFSRERTTTLPAVFPSDVEVADLDGDGFDEIVVANLYRLRGKHHPPTGNVVDTYRVSSFIYHGSSTGYDVARRTELPTVGANAVAIGDVNRDDLPDLVFANSAADVSFIYWNGPRGFSVSRRSQMLAAKAHDCAIADLDRDGHADLVFANYASGGFFDTVSYIYPGGSEGFRDDRRIELPTSGASGIVVADLNGDGRDDIAFVNKIEGVSFGGGTAASVASLGPTTSWIYWGDRKGRFSTDRRMAIPTRRGTNSYRSADFNMDGHADIFYADGTRYTAIYWGSPAGLSVENRTSFPDEPTKSGLVADYNRDGYLDILMNSAVVYGGKSGFSKVNRFVFESRLRYPSVADFDGDGWIDVANSGRGWVTLYFNSSQGFDKDRKQVLELPGKYFPSIKFADVDADGFLDFVAVVQTDDLKPIGPGEAPVHHSNPYTESYIFWGSAGGFSSSRRTGLPTVGSNVCAIADFNVDGHLDVFFSSYLAGFHRHHPGYLYWNSASGFDPSRRDLIPGFSGCGTFAADCNLDGYPELFVANHTRVGNHRSDIWVYRGRPDGFSPDHRESLPATGPHFFSFVDVGNIADRSGRYDYISPAFDAGQGALFESISWDTSTPFHTAVEFQLRTAATEAELEAAVWTGPDGEKSFFKASGSRIPPPPAGHRWMQYKATLVSPNSANTPVLRAVSVRYSS